ncbi:DNA helicase RecQ [Acidaminobacter sp. JC074]|uniref:DNA helicase RecQ n=1 Tax=Acidaminobacter sp. JC074 TaxID=2530199 RepID=UPI001F0DF3B8|nr:DNA helicase RecQ [Acidaminobacter sp. JC074]MCH4886358.1 DNA helicase RecQ [Acidaminobacter sp. JC074]
MNKYELLKKHFGYDTFRYGQEEIIDMIVSGSDVLAIMPTGGGKSLCYQLPALLLDGICIVISPLIALMKDQVDGLNESGIPATYLNSTLTLSESNERVKEIIDNRYKLVYVAPERLLSDQFYDLSQRINISLIAVDESHCISQWGHDFRPSYKNIPLFINRLKTRPVVTAFTATATSYVVSEIKELLELNMPFELTTGFNRENLFYRVVKPKDKNKYVKDYLNNDFDQGSGIIYCSTRKAVESLSQKLKSQGFSAEGYHGGMESDTRTAIQEAFMLDQIKIIVATNAFGMGIDKPDVRFVLHYNMPKNMEAYYQEAGRAGRDGKKSVCILMYSPSDIVKQKLLIAQNYTDPQRDKIQRTNLQVLVNYCHTNDCLRDEIISYFGQKKAYIDCGSCGNCLNDSEFVDMSVESQKILSCIYRTNQRFGTNMIIKVLRGSKDKKIMNWELNKVSTYGIIPDISEGGLRELIMNLIARGYITMTVDQFPILKLNESSRAVLKGETKILVRKERIQVKDKKKSKKKPKTDLDYNRDLYDLLAEKRKSIASKKRVPLYVIFANSVLESMAFYLPTTKEAFLEIKGVGEKKFETYGQDFIDIIYEFKSK